MQASFRGFHLLLALLLLSPLSLAQSTHRFSGFATLGVVSNDNPDLAFRRYIAQDDGSYGGDLAWKTDSLVGVQWQSRWSDQVDTTVQLVAKERLDNALGDTVEWAFVRYNPQEGLDLRLGRMGIDIFMLSDHRQVGYTYPWVRPQHDYYSILSLESFDGIDLSKRFNINNSTLNIKAFYGRSDASFPTGLNSDNKLNVDFEPSGISFELESGNWIGRYSFASVQIQNNALNPITAAWEAISPYWPGASDIAHYISTQGTRFRYSAFGLSYDNNDWWLKTEISQFTSGTPLAPESNQGFISIGRRLGAFTPFVLGGYVRPDRATETLSVPNGFPSPLAEQLALLTYYTENSLNGGRNHQSSVGVGLRWDFAPKMALSMQWEQFRVERDGTNLWLKTDPNKPRAGSYNPRVTSLAMDILF